MIVRSSLKRLANTIYYPMSKKKLTEQWRKPIQQLRQQKQQATPIPPDADHKKKVAMDFMEKEYFSKHKQRPEDFVAGKQPKKAFSKKGRHQQSPIAGTQQQSKQSQHRKSPSRPSDINWLQMNQIANIQQLSELVNEALNMSKLKQLPELKEVLSKITIKFHNDGFQYVLNSLFRQNFIQIYDNLKQLEIEVTILVPRLINTVLFNLAQLEELTRLDTLMTNLKNSHGSIDPRQEDFLELLFFKETSQEVPFEHGQNSVNISSHNKNLVKKLQIAQTYLSIIEQQSKRKRSARRSSIIPLWLDQSSKIVLRYRFGKQQFRKLLTRILTHHEYLLPEAFIQSEQFSQLASQFYFGQQESLKVLLGYLERSFNKNIKFSTFYNNFTDKLMNWRTQTGQSAFEVDQQLIEAYKRGFQHNHKYLSIISAVIASDARYVDLAEHYTKSYMQGFANESLGSEDTKFVEQGIINNYNSLTDTEKHEKMLTRCTKPGQNLFTKLKSSIKLGNFTLAYKIFQQEIYKKVVIQRQRKNIEFVLRSQLSDRATSFIKIKEVNEFLEGLDNEYLWSLYKRSEDISVILKKYIPEDKFSFWEQKQKKDLFDQMTKKFATGHLEKIRQPQSDIDATGFNLDEYLNTEFPQLRELQAQQYQKQKELIKFTLRMEGLIFVYKIHNDDLVIEKFTEFQDELSEQSLQVLETFGLKDYDIKEWGWEHFEKRFNHMKAQSNVIRDERVDWSGYIRFIERNKSLTKKHFVEEMMIKTPELFKEAQALVQLTEEPIVNRLLLWGVYTNEPMAVYLAQKLAMQTGQVIPHDIALKVGRMLSYKRPLSEEFIQRCKQCLKVVGKIDREFIYSFDKEYEHILVRKNFVKYVEDKILSQKYDNREFEDLITFTPRQQLFQNQSKLYVQSIIHRSQLL